MLMRIFLSSAAAAVCLAAYPGPAPAQTTDAVTNDYGIIQSWKKDKAPTLPITPKVTTVAKTPSTANANAADVTQKNQAGAYVAPGGVTNPATTSAASIGPLVRLANGQYLPAAEVKPWMKLWKDKKTAAVAVTK